MTLTNEEIATMSKVAEALGGSRTVVENFLTNVYTYSCSDKAKLYARYICVKEKWNEITYKTIIKSITMAFKGITPDCKNCSGVVADMPFESREEFDLFISSNMFKKRKFKILSDDEIGD